MHTCATVFVSTGVLAVALLLLLFLEDGKKSFFMLLRIKFFTALSKFCAPPLDKAPIPLTNRSLLSDVCSAPEPAEEQA